MSGDTAISIRGLSKAYTIAHGALKRPTFRDVVMERVRHPFRKPRLETFWALKDVSFDVKKGEVVGIIGRNGAGKSTLLKILSRITEPTTGRIELYGRVGSLLEVGTGFHPELTGRENIFLNGAILGMSRVEIRKQFDAIVDFAEVEQFIDTPVKRYSSGMYVRLAFAVAAHLNPEILIVDEVLAVGDAEFQRKCLGKMGEVAKAGRTVLFVSHNMTAVSRLCSRCALLQNGVVRAIGPTSEVLATYLNVSHGAEAWRIELESSSPKIAAWLTEAWLCAGASEPQTKFRMGDTIAVTARFRSKAPLQNPGLGIRLLAQDGTVVGVVNNWMTTSRPLIARASGGEFSCVLSNLRLNPGQYSVTLVLSEPTMDHFTARDAIVFEVLPHDVYGTGRIPNHAQGIVYLDARWSFKEEVTPQHV